MFYKAAKVLSKTAIAFGFMCMVGGCSVEQQELFYLYEALGLAVFAVGAYALEYLDFCVKSKRDMWHMTMMDKKCITVLPGCRCRNRIRRLKMNNQQAIDRLVEHLEWGWTEETVAAIEMGIHALKETQWIPCSEKMPEDNTDVIVCFYSGTVTEMRYWGNGIFQGIYEHTAKTIVAWMPLPELYKGE